jgi:hypothetical protein
MDKITIGCRVTTDELHQIDGIAAEIGQSRAEWLHNLVREALGQTPVDTVRSLGTRVKAIEDRLSRLAR